MNIKSSKGFEIEIQNGLIQQNGFPKGFVITDTNLFKHYKNLIGDNGFIINAEEKSKSIETYFEIINKLQNEDKIISFGGGVVGDLAGFVASTYKRGITLIQIPTSLLAMVDSSIGGKNGINLGKRKNYLGTIYQPEKILIDPSFLETLSIGKPDLQRIEKKINCSDIDLQKIIFQCALIKTQIVEEDEKDKGYRHVLNFGHTIGHALELFCNLSHGEAISIGMINEFKLGIDLGIIKKDNLIQIKNLFTINGLPVDLPRNINVNQVIELIKQDKKGNLIFAFDKENYNVNVREEDIRRILLKCS